MTVEFIQLREPDYATRTKFNAQHSHMTLYFCASEKETPGMSMTMDYSDQFYKVVIPGHNASIELVLDALGGLPEPVVNIAGNSIYRWPDYVTQTMVDTWVLNYLEPIAKKYPNLIVRSGGQTGADWAGIVAAQKLGLDCVAVFPKGFRQRSRQRLDFYNTEEELRIRLNDGLVFLSRLF